MLFSGVSFQPTIQDFRSGTEVKTAKYNNNRNSLGSAVSTLEVSGAATGRRLVRLGPVGRHEVAQVSRAERVLRVHGARPVLVRTRRLGRPAPLRLRTRVRALFLRPPKVEKPAS